MEYPLPPPWRQNDFRYAALEGYFSGQECDAIVELAMRLPATEGQISAALSLDPKRRQSLLRWIEWTTESNWIYGKLAQLFQNVNRLMFQFDLTSLPSLQFTEYRAPAGHYTWHQDSGGGPDFSRRKLSAVVQLSDPAEYEGGRLELFEAPELPVSKGTAIVFPSYEHHRVSMTSRGIRRSLVCWCSGPPTR